ncbi:MAG: acyl carrier protein [Ignavibacteriaceae bacterium]|nr:acyl carrier protein [Ignavibacteriaceae bacterium]
MISDRLKNIVLKELDLDDFDFKDSTTADMVPGWDSLTHIQIIVAVEKNYKIKFKGIEILKIKNMGELQSLIDAKLAAVSTGL